MDRQLKDKLLQVTKALPAAAANADSDSIDLGEGVKDHLELELYCPATPALVDDKTITFTFQDSADDTTFATIEELATKVTTGAASAGAAAFTHRVRLPRTVNRYINVNASVLTAGGDNTGVSYTLSVVQ